MRTLVVLKTEIYVYFTINFNRFRDTPVQNISTVNIIDRRHVQGAIHILSSHPIRPRKNGG